MLSLLLVLASWWEAPPSAPYAEPARGVPYAFSAAGDCTRQGQRVACFQGERLQLFAKPHSSAVSADQPRVWLRVSGLEWQAFHAEQVGEVTLAGERVPVQRLGHPNAPQGGWELATPSEDTTGSEERVRSATLDHGEGLTHPKQAAQAALGCPLVPLDRAPIALLYDETGTLRMLRLQALPPGGLQRLDDLACVAEALAGVQVEAGVRVVEASLSLR